MDVQFNSSCFFWYKHHKFHTVGNALIYALLLYYMYKISGRSVYIV